MMKKNLLLLERNQLIQSAHNYQHATHPILAAQKANLIAAAEAGLQKGRYSVTFKKHMPPSGDKRDFSTLSRYWWPDISKPDGLPYIMKDGVTNPVFFEYDRIPLGHFVDAFLDTATAWYFEGNSLYADQAVGLLQTWFLDPNLRMNPNLEFAGFIPGRNQGRGNGIISTLKFTRLLDWIVLLHEGGRISDTDFNALQAWFKAYRDWLLNSNNGQEESRAVNNHATWYLVQVVAFSLFVGDTDTAQSIIQSRAFQLLINHVKADGSMPEELRRTKSLMYSEYNLNAWMDLATMAQLVGIDLWNFTDKAGSTPLILRAADFLRPFLAEGKAWPYAQIDTFPVVKTLPHFMRLNRVYPHANLMTTIKNLMQIGLPSGRTFFWHGSDALFCAEK
jgi:hypothetical protein